MNQTMFDIVIKYNYMKKTVGWGEVKKRLVNKKFNNLINLKYVKVVQLYIFVRNCCLLNADVEIMDASLYYRCQKIFELAEILAEMLKRMPNDQIHLHPPTEM